MSKSSKVSQSTEANSKLWGALSLVATLASTVLAKKGIDTLWRVVTGKRPPENPADPDVATREAVLWALASGAAVALIKMLVTRRAANYYVASTGHLPGQLSKDRA